MDKSIKNYIDNRSFLKNFIIFIFCCWFSVIGGLVGYALNDSNKDQMNLEKCIKDDICTLYYKEHHSLSKDFFIFWLVDLLDEKKLEIIKLRHELKTEHSGKLITKEDLHRNQEEIKNKEKLKKIFENKNKTE